MVILFLSLWPAGQMPEVSHRFSDKTGHFTAYGMLAFLLIRSAVLSGRMSNRTGRWFVIILLIGSLYGSLLEVLQGVMYLGRSFEYYDILANVTGTVAGLAAGAGYIYRK